MRRTPLATGFLAEMARASRERARALAERPGRAVLERRALAAAPAPRLALQGGFDLIGEVKFASPSAGALMEDSSDVAVGRLALAYARAGACALSVLTEPTRFGGDVTHLAIAARATPLPALRKDFLLDPLQLLEARAAGAAGVLLVLRLLEENTLELLLDTARDLGLFVLLEAFDGADLGRATRVLDGVRRPQLLVGLNARDLATLAVDPRRHLDLAPELPSGVPCVAESGLERASAVRAVAEAGYRAALVGSVLMRAEDPGAVARTLLAAGRLGATRP